MNVARPLASAIIPSASGWPLGLDTLIVIGVAAMFVGTMSGGVDGSVLVTIAINETSKYGAFTLDDEGLTLAKLPPNIDHYSDWVLIGGKPATIYLDCENVTTPITAAYQTTTDTAKTVVRAGQVTPSALDNNKQIINLTEIAQYVRTRLTSTNTTASSVNAKLVTWN